MMGILLVGDCSVTLALARVLAAAAYRGVLPSQLLAMLHLRMSPVVPPDSRCSSTSFLSQSSTHRYTCPELMPREEPAGPLVVFWKPDPEGDEEDMSSLLPL